MIVLAGRFVFILVAITCLSACQSLETKSTADLKINEFHQALSPEDRVRWLNERWNYLRSFYQQNEEPYFGGSTVDGDCEKRSVDQVENHDSDLYSSRSARILTNEAGVSGLCRGEDQTHHMRLVFLVCKKNSKQFDIKRICTSEDCRIDSDQFVILCSRKSGV